MTKETRHATAARHPAGDGANAFLHDAYAYGVTEDTYISVDVEADGPIPGDYSMLALGAVVVDDPEETFYRELKPLNDRFVTRAVEVTGLDRDRLEREGRDPEEVMRAFVEWVEEATPRGHRPVFVAHNASFDWMFVHWYLQHFLRETPFGLGGLDIRALYMGATGTRRWPDTKRPRMHPRFRPEGGHAHQALEDAKEQAEIFRRVLAHARSRRAEHVSEG